MEPEQVNTPNLHFRHVRTTVEAFDEKRQLFPDLLVAEVPGGVLVALHGIKKALTYVPNVTLKTLCEGAS